MNLKSLLQLHLYGGEYLIVYTSFTRIYDVKFDFFYMFEINHIILHTYTYTVYYSWFRRTLYLEDEFGQ